MMRMEASSSTTKMVSPFPRGKLACSDLLFPRVGGKFHRGQADFESRAFAGLAVDINDPSWLFTMAMTVDRPRPVPS